MDESTFFSDMDQDIHPVFSDQDKKKALNKEKKAQLILLSVQGRKEGGF